MTTDPHVIADLEAWLRRVCNTSTGPYLRPFAANAQWRTAQVFLVGTNPSTPLREEFESFDAYWHALTVDTDSFDAAYRRANASKSGQRTKTSTNADRLLGQLVGVSVLRTNAYAYPARKPSEIEGDSEQEALGRRIVTRLLEGIAPRVVIGHGRIARELLRRITRLPLDAAKPVHLQDSSFLLNGQGRAIRVFAIPHLSGAGAPSGYRFAPVYEELPTIIRGLLR